MNNLDNSSLEQVNDAFNHHVAKIRELDEQIPDARTKPSFETRLNVINRRPFYPDSGEVRSMFGEQANQYVTEYASRLIETTKSLLDDQPLASYEHELAADEYFRQYVEQAIQIVNDDERYALVFNCIYEDFSGYAGLILLEDHIKQEVSNIPFNEQFEDTHGNKAESGCPFKGFSNMVMIHFFKYLDSLDTHEF